MRRDKIFYFSILKVKDLIYQTFFFARTMHARALEIIPLDVSIFSKRAVKRIARRY